MRTARPAHINGLGDRRLRLACMCASGEHMDLTFLEDETPAARWNPAEAIRLEDAADALVERLEVAAGR
jgi:hypothetical protein